MVAQEVDKRYIVVRDRADRHVVLAGKYPCEDLRSSSLQLYKYYSNKRTATSGKFVVALGFSGLSLGRSCNWFSGLGYWVDFDLYI